MTLKTKFLEKIDFKPSGDDLALIKKLNMKSPLIWIATVGGLGFCRPAPGTWGTLGALPIALMIYLWGGMSAYIIAFFIFLALGYIATKSFEKQSGSHDSKMIVIDELLGLWIALTPSFFFGEVSVVHIAAAFVLFRIFDIIKPYPIRDFDRDIDGAVGVIADDIVAGQYAAIVMVALMYGNII